MTDDPVSDYWITIPASPERHFMRLGGGPIDNPENYLAVFGAIGIALAAWARVEQHIDSIIIQINRRNYSNQKLDLYDELHPRPFSDKLKTLKRFFNKHPGLQEYKSGIADIATSLGRLAKRRATWAHSIVQDYDHENDIVSFSNVQYQRKTNGFVCSNVVIPLRKVLEFADLVNEINYNLSIVSKDLFSVSVVARLEMPEWQNRSWWRRILDRFSH